MPVKQFVELSATAPDIVAPARGAGQWHDRVDVHVPVEGTKTIPPDRYQRFVATRLTTNTRGVYNWAWFDGIIGECVTNLQRLDFGYMTVYDDGDTSHGLVQFSDGGFAAYPEFLHKTMMSNPNTSLRPWKYNNTWIPNYNNPDYSAWLLELNTAINNHIYTTTIKNVPAKYVVHIIDIRGMGNWGEWHHYPYVGEYPRKLPVGQQPTFDSLKRIVDAHLLGFPNNPLVAMISAHDRERLVNTWNPPAISDYLATARNNWGPVGYRNDHWGGLDEYTWAYLDHPALANVWKGAYITGEPPGSTNGTNNMGDLARQVTKYHVSSFGNGNMGGGESNGTVRNNVRIASRAAGYRLVLDKADTSWENGSLKAILSWRNTGVGPLLEPFSPVFELRNSAGGVVWTSPSVSSKLKGMTGSAVYEDNLATTGVAAGLYELFMIVKHSEPYRKPLPLAITTAYGTGAYSLGQIQVGVGTIPNQPPVALAGDDITITLPTNRVTLAGRATDSDGTVQSYLWAPVPNTGTGGKIVNAAAANTEVTDLTEGEHNYQLTVTDNKGATSSDVMKVIVKAPPTEVIVTSVVATTKYSNGTQRQTIIV